jgi:hypothetical protein
VTEVASGYSLIAAILTTLAQTNAEAAPPRASTEFDAIDDYVRD